MSDRFDKALLDGLFDQVILFAYDAIPYLLNFFDGKLPPRRLELDRGTTWSTNPSRNKEAEIFNDACTGKGLEEYLRGQWSYYNFCDQLGDDKIKTLRKLDSLLQ